MDIRIWNKETRQAYVGTLLYSLLGILAAILAPIAGVSALASFASGSSGGGFTAILLILVELCIIAGYVIFFLAVKDLKNITEGEDRNAFNKVYLSIIFDILAAVFGMIPGVRWLGGILAIVSCVLLLMAYSSLKNSATIGQLSPVAVAGFKQLFTAEVLVAAGIVIGWIPLVGGVVGGILKAVAWVLVLLGWKKVATPVAVPGEAAAPVKSTLDTVKEVLAESAVEAKVVAKDMAGKAAVMAEDFSDKMEDEVEKLGDKLEDLADKVEDKAKEVHAELKEKIAQKDAPADMPPAEDTPVEDTAAAEDVTAAADTPAADTPAEDAAPADQKQE